MATLRLLHAAYFEALGFSAKTQSHGPDGGIDIHLGRPGMPRCRALAQFAAGTRLHLTDGAALLDRILMLPPDTQDALPQIASPSCGHSDAHQSDLLSDHAARSTGSSTTT